MLIFFLIFNYIMFKTMIHIVVFVTIEVCSLIQKIILILAAMFNASLKFYIRKLEKNS